MAAFDRILSGFPQMDEVLDSIRLGDNVVWQISELDEFRTFAEPFARKAVQDGRNVIYIRFAQHEPVLRDLQGVQVRRFDPDEGFEAFTVAIHEEITRQGRDAFYVFDCLSELQSVWYTDLMMGNFFQVTCPYLFELDTVAYFPLIRGRHSFDAVARIRDTTQLLLNVYSNEKYIYVHPMKVWNRCSEQMAILVQRVSGSYYGEYFMPCAAGVGYSHSAYKWMPDMDPGAGMLRIVMGLGTKAVDRTKEDYPRLANLDRPGVTMLTTIEQKHKYSQRYIDLLDCGSNRLAEVSLDTLLPALPLWYKKMVLQRDNAAEARLREIGRFREVWFVSCQKLLETESFTSLMQKLLKTLERVYGNPVDIEFAVNLDAEGDFVVNLLQCRPLYQNKSLENIDLQSLNLKRVFFDIVDSAMGTSCKRRMDVVVQIDPLLYYRYPYQKKYQVVQAVERINDFYKGSNKNLLLITPGRVGTSSPELGVPVTFRSISNFSAVCEVSDSRAGYMPELSYGSHMFQDLVEAQILYGAVYNDRRTLSYHPDLFQDLPDRFGQICPDCPELAKMIQVRETDGLYFWLDSLSNHAVCGFDG